MTVEDYESGEEVVVEFHESDYGRRFLSPDTNREFAEQYIEQALRESGTDIIGKGIIYCVSRPQAAQLTNQLNVAAEGRWPGKYRSGLRRADHPRRGTAPRTWAEPSRAKEA